MHVKLEIFMFNNHTNKYLFSYNNYNNLSIQKLFVVGVVVVVVLFAYIIILSNNKT